MSVVSHQSPGAHTDEVVCCRLIETGGLILQLNHMSRLGPDFIYLVHFSRPKLPLVGHTEPNSSIFTPHWEKSHHLDAPNRLEYPGI